MRLIRGLAALVVLAVGLVAVPAFLVVFVRNPLPTDLDWERVVRGLTRPDDGSILVGVVAVVAWVAWAVFAVSVVVEIVVVVSGQRVRIRLPGLLAPQRLASGLVVAVVSLAVVTPQLSHASPPRSGPEQSMPAARHDEGGIRPAVGAVTASAPILDRVASADESRAPMAHETTYTVERGDDLWSLAERFYGEGREWRKIAAANPDVLSGGPDRLTPGWRLLIPDVSQPPEGRTVVVERGDTLSSIAERVWSDPDRWPEVYEVNRSQLADPDVLPVGVRLAIPESPAEKSVDTDPTPRAGATGGGEDGPDGHGSTPAEREPDALPRSQTDNRQTEKGTQADSTPTEADASAPSKPTASGPEVPMSSPDRRLSERLSAVDPLVAGLAGVGGLLAAAVVSGVGLRRRAQLQLRPVGRRIHQPSPAAQLAEAHLGRRQQPMGLRTLDLATRAIAAHCHRTGADLPELLTASVHGNHIDLELATPSRDAPEGIHADGNRWRLLDRDVDRLRSTPGLRDAVRPFPALVTLGTSLDGSQVVADLEHLRLTSIEAVDGELAEAALAAIAVELSCSPWAEELELIVVGTCERLPDALGRHNVTRADHMGPVLDRLTRRATAQRTQVSGRPVAAHRVDPDLADPWVPTILLVARPLSDLEQLRLRTLVLAEPSVSIVAVGVQLTAAPCRIVLTRTDAGPVARIQPYDLVVTPQLLTATAATAVIDLVEATGRIDTTPAPWWFDGESAAEPDPPDNVTYLGRRFGGWAGARGEDTDDDEREGGAMNRQTTSAAAGVSHPTLQLIGPVELEGAAGTPPSRAAKQCLEYCAWILEHPGTTAQAMGTALAVAEGTRRSNVSRLRSWLGSDALDQPYLPDAYSGRIMLHPAVSTDWQRLQILTGRGVNRTSSSGLEAALQLVRGAPLADAAPGQWHWAEGLRTDMISVIRDIGVELTDRALADGDLELARWSAARALAAAPGDELLIVARIRTEHRAGNDPEVERLTLQLAAHARALEIDLRPETVDVLQQMMEGRVRARLA